MHRLSFNEQVQELARLASTRAINQKDPGFEIYPELLQAFHELLPLNRQRLLLAGYAVYGWMPTQIRLAPERLLSALDTLTSILNDGMELSVTDLWLLAETFRTQNGRSVVAASKILHFLAPQRFPIWDKYVADTWGRPASGDNAAKGYLEFINACHGFAADANGLQACGIFRQQFANAGYGYPMTNMRVLELIFFLRD